MEQILNESWYLFEDRCFLLTDIEKIINKCSEYHGLNSCNHFSSTGLSWGAMLKMIRIELELISNMQSWKKYMK